MFRLEIDRNECSGWEVRAEGDKSEVPQKHLKWPENNLASHDFLTSEWTHGNSRLLPTLQIRTVYAFHKY